MVKTDSIIYWRVPPVKEVSSFKYLMLTKGGLKQ